MGCRRDGDADGATEEEDVLGAGAVELEDAADGRVVAHRERAERVAALHRVLDAGCRGARVSQRAARPRQARARERRPLRLLQAPTRARPCPPQQTLSLSSSSSSSFSHFFVRLSLSLVLHTVRKLHRSNHSEKISSFFFFFSHFSTQLSGFF